MSSFLPKNVIFMLPQNTEICCFYANLKHQKESLYIYKNYTTNPLQTSQHCLFLPSIETVADHDFLKVFFLEMVPAITEDMFVDAERALNIYTRHGAEFQLCHFIWHPANREGIRVP